MSDHYTTRRVERVGADGTESVEDQVAAEAPMEIRIGPTPIAVLMRTPGDDVELATGFALTEGIAIHPHELAGVTRIGEEPEDARYVLEFAAGVTVDPERFKRNLYATSSCGVCGKASIDAVRIAAAAPAPGPHIDGASIDAYAAALRGAQPGFDATGGLHAAALLLPDGTLVAVREDIGRHNAVDKVVGHLVRRGAVPANAVVLCVSGRAGFEIVQKAAVAGIPIVVAVSAPSSLAVELADRCHITLAAFVRDSSCNIYTHPARVEQ